MTQAGADGERRIVVGVDGSGSSTAALAWAVGQARLSGAVLECVHHATCPVVVIREPDAEAG